MRGPKVSVFILGFSLGLVLVSALGFAESRDPQVYFERAEKKFMSAQQLMETSENFESVCTLSHEAIMLFLKGSLYDVGSFPQSDRIELLAAQMSGLHPELREMMAGFKEFDQLVKDLKAGAVPATKSTAYQCTSVVQGFAEFVWMQKEAEKGNL